MFSWKLCFSGLVWFLQVRGKVLSKYLTVSWSRREGGDEWKRMEEGRWSGEGYKGGGTLGEGTYGWPYLALALAGENSLSWQQSHIILTSGYLNTNARYNMNPSFPTLLGPFACNPWRGCGQLERSPHNNGLQDSDEPERNLVWKQWSSVYTFYQQGWTSHCPWSLVRLLLQHGWGGT